MTDTNKYPTPEDVKAYDKMVDAHKVSSVSDYVERYKATPTQETLNSIMKDIILEIPVMQKTRGKERSAFFGILNELSDKWRSFVRHSGNKELNQRAFEGVISQQMPGAYIEWIRYRKLTTRRK
jgi:hypothetical protein